MDSEQQRLVATDKKLSADGKTAIGGRITINTLILALFIISWTLIEVFTTILMMNYITVYSYGTNSSKVLTAEERLKEGRWVKAFLLLAVVVNTGALTLFIALYVSPSTSHSSSVHLTFCLVCTGAIASSLLVTFLYAVQQQKDFNFGSWAVIAALVFAIEGMIFRLMGGGNPCCRGRKMRFYDTQAIKQRKAAAMEARLQKARVATGAANSSATP